MLQIKRKQQEDTWYLNFMVLYIVRDFIRLNVVDQSGFISNEKLNKDRKCNESK